jgi:PhnB protein
MAKRDGFSTLTPYLIFDDANVAWDYYVKVFDAQPIGAQRDEAGVLRHGELRIGDSPIMMCTAVKEYPMLQPAHKTAGSPLHLFVYCDDADALFARSLAHGATVVMEMTDQSYGRSGGVRDPFGFTWWLTTHREG